MADSALQLSTALSDGCLAACAWFGVWWLRRRGERYASSGLICIAVAATLGTARFGLYPELRELHQFASSLGAMVGLPLIAMQYASTCFGVLNRDTRLQWLGVLLVAYATFGLAFPIDGYRQAIGGTAMVVVLVAGAQRFGDQPVYGLVAMAGAVLTVVAGLVIGTTGVIGPFQAIDVFHIVLSISHMCLAFGLPKRYDPPQD